MLHSMLSLLTVATLFFLANPSFADEPEAVSKKKSEKIYSQGRVNDSNRYLVIKLNWKEIDKEAKEAPKRGEALIKEWKEKKYSIADEKNAIDLKSELFIYGGKLRGSIEHSLTGHTPRLDLKLDLSKKPEYLMLRVRDDGYSSSTQWVEPFYVDMDSRKAVRTLKDSSGTFLGVDHSYAITVGGLQTVLGNNASIVAVGSSEKEVMSAIPEKK